MASAPMTSDFEEAFLQCTVCLTRFVNPKILDCHHTFCEHCLKGIVERNYGRLQCPLCRKTQQVPRGGVSLLPSNSYVISLMDYFQSANLDTGDVNRSCKGCQKNAVRHCIECGVFLCQRCSAAHQQLPLSKSHQLVTMETYDENVAKEPPFLRPVLCPRHDGNPIKLFCQTCKLPICVECALFDHPKPKHNFTKLETAAKTRRQQLSELAKTVKEKEKSIEQSLIKETKAVNETKARLETEENKLWDRYNRHVRALKSQADDLQRQLRADTERQIATLQESADKTKDIQKRLHPTITFADNFLVESNDVGFLWCEKQVTGKLQELVRDIDQRPNTQPPPPSIEFISNEEYLENVTAQQIGMIKEEDANSAINWSVLAPAVELPKLKLIKKFPGRGPVAISPVTNNIICRCAQKEAYQVVDRQGQVHNIIQGGGNKDVAVTDDGIVWTTTYNHGTEANKIETCIETGKHFRHHRGLQNLSSPYGFAVDGCGRIYISDISSRSIHVLEQTMKVSETRPPNVVGNLAINSKYQLMAAGICGFPSYLLNTKGQLLHQFDVSDCDISSDVRNNIFIPQGDKITVFNGIGKSLHEITLSGVAITNIVIKPFTQFKQMLVVSVETNPKIYEIRVYDLTY